MDRRQREPIGTTRLIRRPTRNAGTRGGRSKPPRQPRPRQRHRGPRRRGRRSRKLIRPIPMRTLLRLRKNWRLPSGLRLRLREFQEHAAPLAPPAPRRAVPPIARVPVPAADPRGENQPVTTAATGMPATTDNVAWPAPPSMPQTAGAAGSPFPPPPNVGSQPDPSGAAAAQAPSADGSTAAGGASAAVDPPSSATGQQPTAEAPGNDGAAPKADFGRARSGKSARSNIRAAGSGRADRPPGRGHAAAPARGTRIELATRHQPGAAGAPVGGTSRSPAADACSAAARAQRRAWSRAGPATRHRSRGGASKICAKPAPAPACRKQHR